jgi:hypothetical protein
MNFKRAAIALTVTGFIVGAGSGALAEMNEDTRAGQFCGQNEHGKTLVAGGERLTCVKDGDVWRWMKSAPLPTATPAVPVTANPGLTG